VLSNPLKLIADFVIDLEKYADVCTDVKGISHDSWYGPHKTKDLPSGAGAVYVFSLCPHSTAPAGPGRVLKVGKAGANSNARFRYQHYAAGSAMSTLAGAIENNPLLWGYLSYPGPSTEVGTWIRENTDRDNFYFKNPELIGLFEVYAKARMGPVFEGSLSSKA
jgi:hypothetical protein